MHSLKSPHGVRQSWQQKENWAGGPTSRGPSSAALFGLGALGNVNVLNPNLEFHVVMKIVVPR